MNLYSLFYECINTEYFTVGTSANYAVRKDGDTLYIFFEKSDGVTDWRANLDFPAKAYKRMGKTVWLAHRGFTRVWKEIEPFLSDSVRDKSIREIIITGYSHGAAVALLCYEYAWYNRPDIQNNIFGYGFGCPRVLFGHISKEVKNRFTGFTVIRNIDDIVTHLPPVWLGYRHVGILKEIGKKGKYTPIEAHYEENILNELKNTARIYNGVKL